MQGWKASDGVRLYGLNRWGAVRLLIKVFSGSHIKHPSVSNTHTKSFQIDTNSTNKWSTIVSGDGEYLGELPVKISLGTKPLKLLI